MYVQRKKCERLQGFDMSQEIREERRSQRDNRGERKQQWHV
jgi:hypothetical protein